MKVEEYLSYDMLGLAGLIATGEVTAREVLDAALARMAEVNPKINAVVLDLSAQARKETAGVLSGPLAGVPYLVKQHGALLAGTATSVGCGVFKDAIQPSDSAIISALRSAGLVIFGKTNVPELSNDAVTESKLYGPARNPWDLERTPGGSSGGSAAAVAAGIVPAAHATDGGGSIRIPAACTGLFGMKPSRGRVSYAPQNEGGGGFVAQHAVTRSVRDSAALLDIVSRPQPGDPYWLDAPERPYADEVDRDPGSLRIGFSTGSFAGASISQECQDAVLESARLCESLGHRMEEISLPGDYPTASGLVTAVSIAAALDAEARRRGRPIEEDELDAVSWPVYQRGRSLTATEYFEALQVSHAYGRKVASSLSGYDVVLTSTTGAIPPRIGELRQDIPDLMKYFARLFEFMPNTKTANISGQPAMSVPLAWSASGLPIGIQFMGKGGDEATLFRLAGQLEKARPWAGRRPAGLV